MKNNVFTFGDTFWLQLKGTAMGTPAAPLYSIITFGMHENRHILNQFQRNIFYYKRYIDDILGIWLESSKLDWQNFKATLNQFGSLKWNVADLSSSATFLDLSTLKMCRSMRCTCRPNMKLLSSILQKLWPMLKLAQTNRPTDRQGKNNMSPSLYLFVGLCTNFNIGHNFCNIKDSNLIFGMHVYLMELHIFSGERSRSSFKVKGQKTQFKGDNKLDHRTGCILCSLGMHSLSKHYVRFTHG